MSKAGIDGLKFPFPNSLIKLANSKLKRAILSQAFSRSSAELFILSLLMSRLSIPTNWAPRSRNFISLSRWCWKSIKMKFRSLMLSISASSMSKRISAAASLGGPIACLTSGGLGIPIWKKGHEKVWDLLNVHCFYKKNKHRLPYHKFKFISVTLTPHASKTPRHSTERHSQECRFVAYLRFRSVFPQTRKIWRLRRQGILTEREGSVQLIILQYL